MLLLSLGSSLGTAYLLCGCLAGSWLACCPTGPPRSFFAKLLTSYSAPSMYWHMQLLLPRGKTLHFPSVELHEDPLSSSPSCPGPSQWHSGECNFVSSANLLKVNSDPLCRTLMKMLNSSLRRAPVVIPGYNIWLPPNGLCILITILTSWAWPLNRFLINFIIHFCSLSASL